MLWTYYSPSKTKFCPKLWVANMTPKTSPQKEDPMCNFIQWTMFSVPCIPFLFLVCSKCKVTKIYLLALPGKPEEKRPLGRPRHRWEGNIKMDLQKVGCGNMDWIELIQDRDWWRVLVDALMNLWVQQNAGNFLTSWKPVSFSRRILLHEVSK